MNALSLLFTSVMSLWQIATGVQAGTVHPAHVAAAPAAPAGLEDYLRAKMARKRIPGMQVAVVRRGHIVFSAAYGSANLQDDVAVTPRTVFSINSATKTFTGVAILQLAEAGRLELDAPIARYLDDLPAAWQAIGVRQLLNHTSGLPDVLVPPRAQGTGSLVGDGSEADAWKTVQAMPMDFPTGTAYRYNQTNYVLLGRIIDKLAGQPFTTFIAERQFKPAGMRDTGFGDSRDVTPHRAQPYRYAMGMSVGAAPLQHAFDEFPAFLRTGAGINATALDIANWLIALRDGRLLNRESLHELWTPGRFNDGRPTPWAAGWPTIAREEHPAVAGIGGRRSAFYVYPQDDLSVVVLTNIAGANPEEFIDEIASFWIAGLSVKDGGGLTRPLKALHAALKANGWKAGARVASELRRRDPSLQWSEDELNLWGYRLMQEGEHAPSIAVLELNTMLFPRSGNTFDSLAEACETVGDRDAAIRNYRRSLELDPQNTHATNHLRALGAQ